MTRVSLDRGLVMECPHEHAVANAVSTQGRGQLFNLSADPAELDDLYDRPEHAAVRSQLLADLLAWTLRAQDPLPYPKDKYIIKTDPRNYCSHHRQAMSSASIRP